MAVKEDKMSLAETQEAIYDKALSKLAADELAVQFAYKESNLTQAAQLFAMIGDYKDAPQKAQKCTEKAARAHEDGKKAAFEAACARAKIARKDDEWAKVEELLTQLGDYPDAQSKLAELAERKKKKNQGRKVRRGIWLAVLAALLCGGLFAYQKGAFRYMLGRAFMSAGMNRQAAYEFHSAKGFMDSEERIETIRENTLRAAEVGSEVTYGKYTWKILDKDDDQMIMMASNLSHKSDFYGVPFHETDEDVTWEESSLRRYLNEDIYQNGFTEEERSHLLIQTSESAVNEDYATEYSVETEDYITILSPAQIEQYQDIVNTLGANWWLRAPGSSMDTAQYITADHHPMTYGYPVTDETMYSRAVIVLETGWLSESED